MRLSVVLAPLLLAAAAGCIAPEPRLPSAKSGSSPLGPSYVLMPLPSDDDSMLGRILEKPPEPGRSIEEVSAPNPCAAELGPPRSARLVSSFEDAEELSLGAKARATLGVYGFEGDVGRATHFVYTIETERRVARTDTVEYLACCREKGCGYGYVSALVYGTGEYATGEETHAKASVKVAIAGGEASTQVKILHRRKVRGWIAALVTITDPSKKRGSIGVLGDDEPTIVPGPSPSDVAKRVYELDAIRVEGAGDRYVFKDGRGDAIKENEFARRFRGLTGSRELDHVVRRRNWARLGLSGALTGTSLAVMVAGLANLGTHCVSDGAYGCAEWSSDGGAPIAVTGAIFAAGFGAWFLVELAGRYDGADTSHALTDRDAHLYADQYNVALSRKAARDVERSRARATGARVAPFVGPFGGGIGGTF